MKKLLTKIVRATTKWAWEMEAGAMDGAARIKEMHANNQGMEIIFEQDPALAQYIGMAMASMVAEAPNYCEMSFTPKVKWKGQYQFLTVTVQKASGKTPHQLRMEAEERARGFEAQTLLLRGIIARNCQQRFGEDARRLYVTKDDMRISLGILHEEIAAGRIENE